MLGLGIVSRIPSGMIADKIGGLGTLLLGAALQCVALAFYIPFDGLMTLYVVIYRLGPVRARTGRDRAQLRDDRTAVLPGPRSRHPGVSGAHDHRYRYGHRRLDVRRGF